MAHIHLLLGGSVGIGGIVHVARGLVHSVDVEHLVIAGCDLALQLAVYII